MRKVLTQNYKNFAIKQKRNKRKLWYCLSIIIFCVVFVGISILANNKKFKAYDIKNFYIVYAGKYTLSSQATEACTKVSDKGGAGVIYYVENIKFVVASIYFSQTEADGVKQQIESVYSTAGVLKVSTPKLSKNVCNKIEKHLMCKQYYTSFYNLCTELYDLTIKIDTGEVIANDVYKQIMKHKQHLVYLSEQLKDSDNSIGKNMYNSALIEIEQINNFFNSAFVANSVAKHLKKLYVNSVFEFIDMCNSIK